MNVGNRVAAVRKFVNTINNHFYYCLVVEDFRALVFVAEVFYVVCYFRKKILFVVQLITLTRFLFKGGGNRILKINFRSQLSISLLFVSADVSTAQR